MELSYEQIKDLKSLSSDIIAKQCTISEIDKMIANLTKEPKLGNLYLRSCKIEVGDRKLGLSENETAQVLALLETTKCHLEQTIKQRKEEIFKTISSENDPDVEPANNDCTIF